MKKDMIWGILLHLGSNMWGEWDDDLPKSSEEARKRWPNDNPAHLKGYLMAPWAQTIKEDRLKLEEGIKVFAAARRKYYPKEA